VKVAVTEDTLTVGLEDGRTISVPIGWYPRLAYGSPAERANFQISGAGYGIHWPDLDEDIGVEGVLVGKKSSESHTSFQRWLEQRQQSASQYHFTVIIEHQAENEYLVSVPALPGCYTEGRTLEEAREMAADAIQAYCTSLLKHGEPIPVELPEQQTIEQVTVALGFA
jgi:predicted RNase H-like HicB family nuclease